MGGDSLSRWLANTPRTCLVGTRTADGRYPSRTAARIASIGGRTTRLAYRGWQAGIPEPAILAVCTIADVPGAREFLSGRLGGQAMDAKALRAFAKSAGATKTEEWGVGVSPHVMPGAAPVFMIDGLASRFPTIRGARRSIVPMLGGGGDAGVMVICADPSGPDCAAPGDPPPPPPPPPPPTCDPYEVLPQPGCEETVPPIPPQPTMPSPSSIGASASNQCWGQTEWPHLSRDFAGRVSVHANTSCDTPTSLSVTVTLHRRRCQLWIFCGWPQIGDVGTYSNSSARIGDANANAACVWADGWFMGKSWHTAKLPEGPAFLEREGNMKYIDCFPLNL